MQVVVRMMMLGRKTFLTHTKKILLLQQQQQPQQQQRQFGRKAGHKSFYKIRTPTPKQRRKFVLKKSADQFKINKHSVPNIKASAQRQETQNIIQKTLEYQTANSLLLKNNNDDGSYNKFEAAFDDLMGNTAYLTSAPNPKPANIAADYRVYLNQVLEKLNNRKQEESSVSVPTDDDISLLIRSHRDKYGHNKRRIGIHAALQHILEGVNVPVKYFGMKSYSSLMTCARSAREARRIMQLMFDHGFVPNAYIYSILVDVYADARDLDGCLNVMKEMRSEPNFLQPDLTIYTSLLKVCYKIVNDTSMPSSLKARAGKAGWEVWKELRMNGLQPDVMAYGAIVRLSAARGQAEQCIGFIDEMEQFSVKPTTLIFSAALRGVARSHKNALRFEGGKSPKNMRRKKIAAYHGNMARQLVVRAESVKVEQDDGFIAALMMCAAAQGDSASAKAILIASDIRRMDHLRTIGSEAHIKSLRPPQSRLSVNNTSLISSGDINNELLNHHDEPNLSINSQEDAFRSDTRKLTALLSSFSTAIESGGLGDLWGGSMNKGFLNEDTLFRLKQINAPTYHDNTIPGMSGTDVGLSGLTYDAEKAEVPVKDRKFKLKKFEGLKEVEDAGFTLDDIDEDLYEMYKDEDKSLLEKLKALPISDDDQHIAVESSSDSSIVSCKKSRAGEMNFMIINTLVPFHIT